MASPDLERSLTKTKIELRQPPIGTGTPQISLDRDYEIEPYCEEPPFLTLFFGEMTVLSESALNLITHSNIPNERPVVKQPLPI